MHCTLKQLNEELKHKKPSDRYSLCPIALKKLKISVKR